jgi:hypothetical protein
LLRSSNVLLRNSNNAEKFVACSKQPLRQGMINSKQLPAGGGLLLQAVVQRFCFAPLMLPG